MLKYKILKNTIKYFEDEISKSSFIINKIHNYRHIKYVTSREKDIVLLFDEKEILKFDELDKYEFYLFDKSIEVYRIDNFDDFDFFKYIKKNN